MRYPARALAGLLLFLGGALYAILTLVAETAYPSYSTSADYISSLGVGPTAAWWTAALFLAGFLGLGGVYLLHRSLRPRLLSAAGLFTIFLALFAIGAIGVGVFNEDTPLHGPFASIAFISGGLSAILSVFVVRSPLRFVFPVLGALGLVAMVLFLTHTDLGLGPGGMERMIVLPALIFETALGAHLAALPETSPAIEPAKGVP